MEKSLAFLDLLGFSSMVETSSSKARNILSDFYNIVFREIDRHHEIDSILFSDSLIAYSNDSISLLNSMCNIYRACLRRNIDYTQRSLGNFFLLPRGGMCVGHINIEERNGAPNVRKEFIVSPALVHSARMEKSIQGSRFLIAEDSFTGNIAEWNYHVHRILYRDNESRTNNNHTYTEALWFGDLSKESEEQKREIVELLGIAISLVEANAGKDSVLKQHIGTLRIGMLSYSKLYETLDIDIISRIIDKFSEDKFWLIWVSLFEMVLERQDCHLSAINNELMQFYRSICLTIGWQNAIEYLNRPENSCFKVLLNQFIAQ